MRFLALGDSYTIGESVPPAERWPVQLAALLRQAGFAIAEPDIIATTGWTTDELAAGIDRADPRGPYELVSLLIGVNNQYRDWSEDEYRAQFAALLQRAIAFAGGRPRRVLVLSIPDWGVTPFAANSGRNPAGIAAAIDRFNALNRAETERAGAAYVDVTPISRRALTNPALIANDGLHPSGAMYAEWASAALPAARAALAEASSKMIGAFFDIDGTLTSDNVWKGLMTFFRQRQQRRWTHRAFMLTHYPLAFLRPMLISEAMFRRLWAQHLPWYFRGYDEAQMTGLAEWVAHEFVAPIARADVLEKLRAHVEQGEMVALVSGAPQPVVRAIAQMWGVPHAVGSPAAMANGRYTGGMAGPPCIDAQKAVYLQRYLTAQNIRVDFAASYAYADSHSDLAMFELVGHPVAVYPDSRLRALAAERKWEVMGE